MADAKTALRRIFYQIRITMNEPQIIFEDDDVLVLDKPIGWLVHEDGKGDGPTVVEWFLRHCPAAEEVGEIGYSPEGTELNRSGVVHRLDRETSGVLIMAKTQSAHVHLKKRFKDRLVHKEYRALVYGRMKERWGTISAPIGRSGKDARQRSALPGAKGTLREAVTEYESIKEGEYNGEIFSFLRLVPKTGRTHQLRVHLRYLDRPIVGDQLYAEYKIHDSNNLNLDRMALHAESLELTLPSGEKQVFKTPLPDELQAAVAKLK